MSCNHKGGPELIAMAEEHLRGQKVPESEWPGMRFRWAENVDGMWSSVIVEIERRDAQWIVTRLDRRKESLDASEIGFRSLTNG